MERNIYQGKAWILNDNLNKMTNVEATYILGIYIFSHLLGKITNGFSLLYLKTL